MQSELFFIFKLYICLPLIVACWTCVNYTVEVCIFATAFWTFCVHKDNVLIVKLKHKSAYYEPNHTTTGTAKHLVHIQINKQSAPNQ